MAEEEKKRVKKRIKAPVQKSFQNNMEKKSFKKTFVQVKGLGRDKFFTNRADVAEFEKEFVKLAKNRPHITWVVPDRETALSKSGEVWSQPPPGGRTVGYMGGVGSKFGETVKYRGKDYYIPDVDAAREASKNRKFPIPRNYPLKSHASFGAILEDIGKRHNISVKREFLTDKDIGYWQKALGKDEGFKKAVQVRDQKIKDMTTASITFTRGGGRKWDEKSQKWKRTFVEGSHERDARNLYENLAEKMKKGHIPKVGESNKLINQFIDEVNIKGKYSDDFKQGAFDFLQNKNLNFQFQGNEATALTQERLADMKGWDRAWNAPTGVGRNPIDEAPQGYRHQSPVSAGDHSFFVDHMADELPETYKISSKMETGNQVPIRRRYLNVVNRGTILKPKTVKEKITKSVLTRGYHKGNTGAVEFEKPLTVTGYRKAIPFVSIKNKDILGDRKSVISSSLKSLESSWNMIPEEYTANKKESLSNVERLLYGDVGDDILELHDDSKQSIGISTSDVSTEQKDRQLKVQEFENIEKQARIEGWGTKREASNTKPLVTLGGGGYFNEETRTIDPKMGISNPDIPYKVTERDYDRGEQRVSQEGDVDARGKITTEREITPSYIPTDEEKKRVELLSQVSPEDHAENKKQYAKFRNIKIKERNERGGKRHPDILKKKLSKSSKGSSARNILTRTTGMLPLGFGLGLASYLVTPWQARAIVKEQSDNASVKDITRQSLSMITSPRVVAPFKEYSEGQSGYLDNIVDYDKTKIRKFAKSQTRVKHGDKFHVTGTKTPLDRIQAWWKKSKEDYKKGSTLANKAMKKNWRFK